MSRSEAADQISKFAFLFANIFNDVQIKNPGSTIAIREGDKCAIGSIALSYGSAFVDMDLPNDNYIVILQKQNNVFGNVNTSGKTRVGFYIKSDVRSDCGTVDYLVIRKI